MLFNPKNQSFYVDSCFLYGIINTLRVISILYKLQVKNFSFLTFHF